MRIAILSNVTVEVLAGMLRKEHSVWTPPGFGGWMEIALDVPEDLKQFDPEAVFLLLDSSHAEFDPSAAETAVAALEASLPRTTVIVPDLSDLAEDTTSTLDLDLKPRPGTGRASDPFYDDRMWQLGKMPWSMKGLRAIKGESVRLIEMTRGNRLKALAVDFDNTLWKGVIGEDGVDGIEPFADFQRELKAMRERGVLLVGLSKNNAADVEPVWSDPRMVLTKDDFVAMKVDWNDKPENLSEVARKLNLGIDAFVFVDDNPAERAQMAARRPEVTVAEWPISGRRLARKYFPRMRVTDEDRRKTEQYQSEAKRQELAATLSVEDYLKSLEIRTEIHPILESEYARVAQLSQKTNQFNVCTNRYTVEDIARFAADPAHLIVTVHVSDRFGDQGIVAFVNAKREKVKGEGQGQGGEGVAVRCTMEGDDEWVVVDWVMSCRVMNRRIEFTVQEWVEKELRHRGAVALHATWRKTLKNAPVEHLFDRFGFNVQTASDAEKRYVLELA